MPGVAGYTTLMIKAHADFWPAAVPSAPRDDALLEALLTLGLPELSSAEDFCAVETYVRTAGRRNARDDELPADAHTQRALLFWVYPARMWGPCREAMDKETGLLTVQRHGLLMTVEEGAFVGEVLEQAREHLRVGTLRHVHDTPP